MVLISLSPKWFYGYDIALEMLFFVTSVIVALLAFKIYKKSAQKSVGLFGVSFSLIGIAYLIQSLLNFLILSKANEGISLHLKMHSIAAFNNLGMLVHVFFMTVGLSILTYITFKQNGTRLLWLLIFTSLSAVYFSKNSLYMFYVFSSIFLVFVSWYFVQNYLNNKKLQTLLIAIAFLFLLSGHLHFLFSIKHQLFYALGHILELVAYVLILINYYMVLKK